MGKKGFRYYQYVDQIKYRSRGRMTKQGRKAARTGTTVRGLKGTCIISSLPRLDLSTSTIPKYMHSVLLGVVKQFLTLWFTPASKCNLTAFADAIDELLLNIKPTDDIHVLPRSIKLHGNYWKASELYYWLLFYSLPILHCFLTENYFNHWVLLVTAVILFCRKQLEGRILIKLKLYYKILLSK